MTPEELEDEDYPYEDSLEFFADIIDQGAVHVTLTSQYLRDLAEEIRSLRENN